jgi:hypothetical protein
MNTDDQLTAFKKAYKDKRLFLGQAQEYLESLVYSLDALAEDSPEIAPKLKMLRFLAKNLKEGVDYQMDEKREPCKHDWLTVVGSDHSRCGQCFMTPEKIADHLKAEYPKGYCPHSFKVCTKCDEARGWGSHGELSLVPDGCKSQIEFMRKGLKVGG